MMFFAVAAVVVASWAASAWLLMLGVGIVHLHWIPALPTLGYPLALLITMLFALRAGLGAGWGTLIRHWADKK